LRRNTLPAFCRTGVNLSTGDCAKYSVIIAFLSPDNLTYRPAEPKNLTIGVGEWMSWRAWFHLIQHKPQRVEARLVRVFPTRVISTPIYRGEKSWNLWSAVALTPI
jgi:hypothetical protein